MGTETIIARTMEETLLSTRELAAIDAELAHVPYKSAAAIDALKIVQAERGWISDASLRAIACHLEMSAAELDGVATFYNLIYRRPVGEQVILLCNSVTCWIKGWRCWSSNGHWMRLSWRPIASDWIAKELWSWRACGPATQ